MSLLWFGKTTDLLKVHLLYTVRRYLSIDLSDVFILFYNFLKENGLLIEMSSFDNWAISLT